MNEIVAAFLKLLDAYNASQKSEGSVGHQLQHFAMDMAFHIAEGLRVAGIAKEPGGAKKATLDAYNELMGDLSRCRFHDTVKEFINDTAVILKRQGEPAAENKIRGDQKKAIAALQYGRKLYNKYCPKIDTGLLSPMQSKCFREVEANLKACTKGNW